MQVVIAGGGTGGHVFPALAVGGEFVKRGANLLFVGTKKGLESELVPKRGWDIEYLSASKWKGQSKLKRLLTVFQMPFAILRAFGILSRFKADVVIGVGGYVSVPTLLAAILKRSPTLIMEQNSIPGLANRVLGRFVKKICVTYPASKLYFKDEKTLITGNPTREEIREVGNSLPSFQGKFVLMCFGGSQGARSINEALLSSLRLLRDRRDVIKIIHQVGINMDIDVVRGVYEKEGFNAEVYRFIDDIADCYSRSHMAICRAGATSVAELMVVARPAVLVPYPYAANNHQEMNAKYVADNGGAVMLLDKDLNGEEIAKLIVGFMNQTQKLVSMNEAMKNMARPDAAEKIVDECYKLAS
jgi:UDP-N-acetylglucosamine--N-acetylmuramyl-(pentapeptide) pyrophosphoryl-undecaprenol N-acetylglucosamine transferase